MNIGAASLFATSGTAFVAVLPGLQTEADDVLWPWMLGGGALAAVAWSGVWAWWQDRPLLTIPGAWAAVALNLPLSSAVLVPLAFAFYTSTRAVVRSRQSPSRSGRSSTGR